MKDLTRFSSILSREQFNAGSLSDQSKVDLEAYFNAVRQRYESGEQYPYTIDDMVPVVYTRRDNAIRVLTDQFKQDVDFIGSSILRNDDNPKPQIEYRLSPLAFEFLVARKSKDVFDIYHRVFHAAARVATIAEVAFLQSQALMEHQHRLDGHEATLATQGQKIQILEKNIETLVTVIHQSRQRRKMTADARQAPLDLDPPAKRRKLNQGGTHAGPRQHRRRGHYRTLPDGRRIEVRATVVGRRNKGGESVQ